MTYGGATSHGSQQAIVNLNHFLDRLTSDPVSRRRSRIRRHDNSALKAKGQRRGAMCQLDGTIRIGPIIRRST